MFEKKRARELELPPLAKSNAESFEILRVWSGGEQQVVLKTTWKDPGAWGLMLADLARHAANAYANEGQDRTEALARIREMFNAELAEPTDEPAQI